jgi:glycosyltransferase involved in cell wall biosynthesis
MAQPEIRDPKRPFFSIITVSYNAENVIRPTLQSVAEQRGVEGLVEHWVIDGASKDGTLDVVRQFPHVRYLSEPDKGITDAFNKGMKVATGEYIIYLNCDDLFLDDRVLLDLYEFAQANNMPDWIIGRWYVRRLNGDVDFVRPKLPIAGWSLFTGPRICHQAVVLKRDIQEKMGGFNLKYKVAMDYDMWARLYLAGYKITNFHRPLIVYADGGFSTQQKGIADHDHNAVKERLRDRWWKRLIGAILDRYKVIQERNEVAARNAT